VIAPMMDRGPRSSYEPEWLLYTEVAARHAVRLTIGQKLRACYEVPQHLPDELLTLLMRLRERKDEK
jgi:hypothetical protein